MRPASCASTGESSSAFFVMSGIQSAYDVPGSRPVGFDEGTRAVAEADPWGGELAAGFATLPYDPNFRRGKCVAKDHRCEARRALGTKYCVGHLRAFGLYEKARAEAEEAEAEQE